MDALLHQHQVKVFIGRFESDPSFRSHPSISFFHDFLARTGKLLASADGTESQPREEEESEYDEIVESEIEFEGETVEPDIDPPQKMGDSSVEVSDENREASQEAQAKGVEAVSNGNLEEGIEQFTNAILLNPTSALMYAMRASVYIKLKKPNAAIRDADAALQLSPMLLKGYKSRGTAWSMLGEWEKAAKDLCIALSMDFDEEINNLLKQVVEPNVHKAVEHRRKYVELRKKQEAKRRRRAENKASPLVRYPVGLLGEVPSGLLGVMPSGLPGGMSSGLPGGMSSGLPGGMPSGLLGAMPSGLPGGMFSGLPDGMPSGLPGGMLAYSLGGGMHYGGGVVPGGGAARERRRDGLEIDAILYDPEIMAAFEDNNFMDALQDVIDDPASLRKYQANPMVANMFTKMLRKVRGPKWPE